MGSKYTAIYLSGNLLYELILIGWGSESRGDSYTVGELHSPRLGRFGDLDLAAYIHFNR